MGHHMCQVEGLCPESRVSGRGVEHHPSARAALCGASVSAR